MTFCWSGVKRIFTKTQIENPELRNAVQHAFNEVRAEMDEHLDAINQNAAETHTAHARLQELDAKVDKLSDKIDELFMLLSPEKGVDFSTLKLSLQEQEVFLVLYGVEGPITPAQVGRKLGLSAKLAAQYLYNLQIKGVPMLARNWEGELFYSLDLKFKDLQARKNILRISSPVFERVSRLS